MAGFINFQNGQYNQDSFNKEFGAIVGINEKIVVGDSSSLKVTQTNPLANKVKITSGEAFINGKFIYFDSATEVTVESNMTEPVRFDNVVVDLTGENTAPVIKVVKGGSGTPPKLSPTQCLLAELTVVNNSLSISDREIKDMRNLSTNAVSNAQRLAGHTIDEFELKADYTRRVIYTDNDQKQRQVIEKWADGRMKITQTYMVLTPIATSWGSLYVHKQNGTHPHDFIEPFKTVDIRTYSVKPGKSDGRGFSVFSGSSPTTTRMGIVNFIRPLSEAGSFEYSAVLEVEGTWK